MDLGEEDLPSGRAAVVPSLTSRTLPRASLLPLYLDAGFARHPGGWISHTVPAITPDEIYYTDPSSGGRIPNIVTDFRAFECFRLNTPLPVMTPRLAPPTLPDPFRSGPHPTRDLGSSSWNSGPLPSPLEPPSRGIVQLTLAEDQTVTNLLKLHHQEPGPGHHTPTEEADGVTTGGRYPGRAGFGDQLQEWRRSWTDAELEAADILLSGFVPTEGDSVGARFPDRSAVTPPDPLTHRGDTQQESDSVAAFPDAHSAESDGGFTGVREAGGPGSVSRDSPEATAEMLSVFEGGAVCGLLCLRDLNILERLFQY